MCEDVGLNVQLNCQVKCKLPASTERLLRIRDEAECYVMLKKISVNTGMFEFYFSRFK